MEVNQIKVGAFLSYVIIALNNVIGLLYTPFMLRMMGQTEYGLYSLVASVVAYLTVLDFGFGNAIVRYTAKLRAEGDKEKQYEMFGVFLILYSVIGLLTFLIGLVIYTNVDVLFKVTMSLEEMSKVRIMLLLMICNLAFTFPMSIFGSIITAYENFIFQKVVNLLRIILNPVVMILMLLMGYRAIGMVVIVTIFNVLTLLINAWYCFYKLKIRVKVRRSGFDWGFLKEVSVYSFWIFLNAIMDRIYWDSGQFILGVYTGVSIIAVYAVALQLVNIYKGFSTAIAGLFLPRITAMVTNNEGDGRISDLFIKTGRLQYIIMAFILSGFVVFGKYFIIFWAGPDYVEAYYIALVLFVPLFIPLIQNIGITILQAKNKMKFRSILYAILSIGSLGISIPLAKQYGGIGCAVGTASALVIGQIIIMNIYYHKKVGLDMIEFWKEIGRMSVVPALLCSTSLVLLQYIHLDSLLLFVVAVILFSIVYMITFWFKGMNQYERNLFLKPIKKVLGK
ncbi:oligosaccharide flippase family protein [Parabacteroides chongii]|uniref:oligosaccharide flippase family protein n=1 Tax=Parabacteroides chongii TaxID=2685834 RepID=UPI00240E5081|nr:oligosaccharide flippase family protein [Parabacteroides chongii]WFE83632.1 oligosaccharide flippase family protein [Parabacteroides chongii]